jgi:integrase
MARPRLEQPRHRLQLRGGTYYVAWWVDGAWRRVSTRTTERSAADRFLAQFAAGALNPAPPPQPTLDAVLDGYLADRKPQVASYDTLRHACAALRRHLGDLTPEHLNTPRIRLYGRQRRAEGYEVGPASNRRRKPVADATVARELVTLRSAIRWAIAEKWIPPEAEPKIEVPTASRPRQRYLTADEAARLLAVCQAPHAALFVAIGLYTGARSGAILDLTWRQVDFTAGLIDFGSGSGNKRRAVVPITDALRPRLVEAHAGRTTDRVIEHGGRGVDSVKTGFAAARRRAGLGPDVTPHILRHTAATWMMQRGVAIREAARFLGMSEKTVETVYGKFNPSFLRNAAAALDGVAG